MKSTVTLVVLTGALCLSGCVSNPNIPTYSGAIRAAVVEKANAVGSYVRGQFSTPLPAWDPNTPAAEAPKASKVDQGTLTKDEMSLPGPASVGTVVSSGVEVYSLDNASPLIRPLPASAGSR